MNYTQSFEEFSSGVGPTDLALYAGIGIVLFILFKDKISPIQKIILDFVNSTREQSVSRKSPEKSTPIIGPATKDIFRESDITKFLSEPLRQQSPEGVPENKDKVFFELISSWKKTRDLAEKYSCEGAVKMLDDVFQYLIPKQCDQVETNSNE